MKTLPKLFASIVSRSLAFGVGLLMVLVLAAVLNTVTTVQQQRYSEWVSRTHVVLDSLQAFRTHVSEARAAIRGYTQMDVASDLAVYQQRAGQAKGELALFASLTRDNLDQQAAAARLGRAFGELEGVWTRSLAMHRTSGKREALLEFNRAGGPARVDELYAVVEQAEANARPCWPSGATRPGAPTCCRCGPASSPAWPRCSWWDSTCPRCAGTRPSRPSSRAPARGRPQEGRVHRRPRP